MLHRNVNTEMEACYLIGVILTFDRCVQAL